jgi:hypothetical protein
VLCYPARRRESWQADFAGVVRLAESGALYWINVWLSEPRGFALSIKPKEGAGKSVSCQLRTEHGHPERYTGSVQMTDGVRYAITLWPDDQPARYLSVHFALEGGVEP